MTSENRKAYVKKYRKDNADKIKRDRKIYNLQSRYGLTLEEYEHMVAKQNGVCLVCSKSKRLVIDHCHTTGKVRGLLCHRCNAGLAYFYDSIEAMKRAALYLAGEI